MNYYIQDNETTGAVNDTNADPFCSDNVMVLLGIRTPQAGNKTFRNTFLIPDGEAHVALKELEDRLCVGFNIKFDMHWNARYGLPLPKKIWDCQLAQYIIWRQKIPWISLDMCLKEYGFPLKIDIVKEQYWNKGIDTDEVPPEILDEYLCGDLEKTEQVYRAQLHYLADKPHLLKLIQICNEDLLTTFEMEENGIVYDRVGSILHGNEVLRKMEDIYQELKDLVGADCDINWNSPNQCSAVLYGGVINEKYRETYSVTLKSGETKQKERWSTREVKFPTLYSPPKKWQKAKEGIYSVDEACLKVIAEDGKKLAKTIAVKLLEVAKLEKLVSSYLHKYPKLMENRKWGDFLRGKLVHCVTRTGRLSSNDPNQQNNPPEVNQFIRSRFNVD